MPRWDGVQEVIGDIQALKRQQSRDEAQEMLEKVYKYVAPIMRKRHYRVHRLVEFLPKDNNLLGVNVNRGQRISLRLRYNHDSRQFLAFENVLGTMLHELCHNTFGPHDHQFFALLDELTQEMEDMIAKGYRGDEFTAAGKGRRLPVAPGSTRRAPYTTPGRLSQSSGYKLGGLGGRLPRGKQALRERALQAAERRREADLRCRAVKKVEDLTSDESGDVVEISAEEFNSARQSPVPQPGARKVSTPSAPRDPRPPKPKIDPEIICLLSDEE